jgi:dienelactone hydrolase
VVSVNAGVIHRVGPTRIYVDVARGLAERGYCVLRFDLSGLGDSESFNAGITIADGALADIDEALNFMASSRGADRFVLLGLCSGANHALLQAFEDARVVGTMLIDPSVQRTRKSWVIHLARRLLHASTLRAIVTLQHPLFRRGTAIARGVAVAQAAEGAAGRMEVGDMGREAVVDALNRTIERGVQFMFAFTGGVNHIYNYRDQLFDLLPGVKFGSQLRLEYIPETDHTISDQASRSRLIQSIGDWLEIAFPSTASEPSAAGQAATQK